ncbi:hypothetical protein ACM55K_02815 [Flavobacterium sp. LT1R49]|uniref:hypothetical protein n=1 Tax=Flavobacterium TaxID=237 RepID=UPI003A8C4E30
MKKQTGIWIDTSKAIIVTLDGGKEKIMEIESDIENRIHHNDEGNKGTFSGSHHGSNETKLEERKKNQMNHFLKDVLSHVHGSDELFVFGPAETKIELEKKIKEDKSINNKLKSVETTDSLTSNQIVAKVKDFYNHA